MNYIPPYRIIGQQYAIHECVLAHLHRLEVPRRGRCSACSLPHLELAKAVRGWIREACIGAQEAWCSVAAAPLVHRHEETDVKLSV